TKSPHRNLMVGCHHQAAGTTRHNARPDLWARGVSAYLWKMSSSRFGRRSRCSSRPQSPQRYVTRWTAYRRSPGRCVSNSIGPALTLWRVRRRQAGQRRVSLPGVVLLRMARPPLSVGDVPGPLRSVTELRALNDVEHRVGLDVSVVWIVFVIVFVWRVDLGTRGQAVERVFEGPVLLGHQPHLGVAADLVAVALQPFNQLVDRHLCVSFGGMKNRLAMTHMSHASGNSSS